MRHPVRHLVVLPLIALLVACGPADVTEPQPERDTDTLTGDPSPLLVEVDGALHFGDEVRDPGDITSMVVRAYGPPGALCQVGRERCAVGSVLVQRHAGPTRYDVLWLEISASAGRAEAVVRVAEESGEPGPSWFHFTRVGGPCGGSDPDCAMTLTVEDSEGHRQRARFGTLIVRAGMGGGP